jgi:hypothetical protein
MTSSTVSAPPQQSESARRVGRKASVVHPSIVLLGRLFFSLIFILSTPNHFLSLMPHRREFFWRNHSPTLRHHGTAGRIKHSIGLSSEARHVDNCAISDSGVARHA